MKKKNVTGLIIEIILFFILVGGGIALAIALIPVDQREMKVIIGGAVGWGLWEIATRILKSVMRKKEAAKKASEGDKNDKNKPTEANSKLW